MPSKPSNISRLKFIIYKVNDSLLCEYSNATSTTSISTLTGTRYRKFVHVGTAVAGRTRSTRSLAVCCGVLSCFTILPGWTVGSRRGPKLMATFVRELIFPALLYMLKYEMLQLKGSRCPENKNGDYHQCSYYVRYENTPCLSHYEPLGQLRQRAPNS